MPVNSARDTPNKRDDAPIVVKRFQKKPELKKRSIRPKHFITRCPLRTCRRNFERTCVVGLELNPKP